MKLNFANIALPVSLALGVSFSMATDADAANPKAKPAAAKAAPVAKPVVKPKVKSPLPAVKRTRVGLMMNMETGEIIGGENGALNPDTRFNPASMTKIMTLYIALQKIEAGTLHPDQVLKIPHAPLISESNDRNLGDALLNEGNWINGKPMRAILRADVDNIIKAILVSSSNNGCIALANEISGSEKEFAELMNQTAQKMGLKNSHFMNSTGFPRKGEVKDHYVSARDLMIIMRELTAIMKRVEIKNPDMFKGIAGEKITLEGYNKDGLISYPSRTHSKLVIDGEYKVPGINIVKTAYSKPAGWGTAMTAKIKDENVTYTVGYVVGGFNTQKEREEWISTKMKTVPNLLKTEKSPKLPYQEFEIDLPATSKEKSKPSSPLTDYLPGIAVIFGLGAAYACRKKILPALKQKPHYIHAGPVNGNRPADSSLITSSFSGSLISIHPA